MYPYIDKKNCIVKRLDQNKSGMGMKVPTLILIPFEAMDLSMV